MLPFEDNVVALHGGAALMVEARHHQVRVPTWGQAGLTTLGEARHMSFRTVVFEGAVSGLWEYDPRSRAIATHLFAAVPQARRARLEKAIADTARFMAEELGHGRSFSLDTDDDLSSRSAAVRALGRGAVRAAAAPAKIRPPKKTQTAASKPGKVKRRARA